MISIRHLQRVETLVEAVGGVGTVGLDTGVAGAVGGRDGGPIFNSAVYAEGDDMGLDGRHRRHRARERRLEDAAG